MLLGFKLYYKAIVIKQYGINYIRTDTQKTGTDQKAQQCEFHIQGQLIYDKRARIYNTERTVFLITGVGKTEETHAEEGNWTTVLHSTQKINSKWIKDLNVRPESIKLLEENRQ